MSDLTTKMVIDASDELKNMFIAEAEGMRRAWNNMEGDLSISCSVKWKPSSQDRAINADIQITFPIGKVKTVDSFTFADGMGPLFEKGTDDDSQV